MCGGGGGGLQVRIPPPPPGFPKGRVLTRSPDEALMRVTEMLGSHALRVVAVEAGVGGKLVLGPWEGKGVGEKD